MIVSWVTMDEPGSNTVIYWTQNSKTKLKAEGMLTKYSFFNYTSGFIHHCNITHLKVTNSISHCHFIVWIYNRQKLTHIDSFRSNMAAWYKILLQGRNWSYISYFLVYYSSWSWTRCSLHFWPHWYCIFISSLKDIAKKETSQMFTLEAFCLKFSGDLGQSYD